MAREMDSLSTSFSSHDIQNFQVSLPNKVLNFNSPSEAISSIAHTSFSNLTNPLQSNKIFKNTSVEFETTAEDAFSIQEYIKNVFRYEQKENWIEVSLVKDASSSTLEKAEKEEILFEGKIDGNTLNAKGDGKLEKVLAEAKDKGIPVRFLNSNNEAVEINNVTFKLFSESEKKYLYSAAKVHILYLQRQEALKKAEEEKQKEKEIHSQYLNSTPKNKLNGFDKKTKQKKVNDSPTSFTLKSRNASTREKKIDDKIIELERLKAEMLKEKEEKKLEKKISDRKFYEMNDIIKTIINDETLKIDIVKRTLLVVEIKKEFDLAPQFSKAILKSA